MTLTAALFTKLLKEVGQGRIEVLGSSMLPAIRPGDVLQVESRPVEIGDVVVFDSNGYLCAHRLVYRKGSLAVTRGDANQHFDTPFDVSEILGRVNSLERDGKTVTNLRPWKLMSFFIRNSSLCRRLYLKIHSRLRAVPASSGPDTFLGLSKSQ
jgi:signal peptidase I